MRVGVSMMVMASALAIGGCANQRYAQDVDRLKSDVNLINERLSQMERSSFGQPSTTSAAWPADSSFTQPLAGGTRSKAQPGTSALAKPSKKEIQQALKNAGFYQGPIDGKVGPVTRDAVKEFQRTNGLKADGVVGRQTWEKLAAYLELAAKTGDVTATMETVIK